MKPEQPGQPFKGFLDQASADTDATGPKEFRSELDESVIEELVTLARRTDAAITFVEDARPLVPARHVGAMLRYRI